MSPKLSYAGVCIADQPNRILFTENRRIFPRGLGCLDGTPGLHNTTLEQSMTVQKVQW